MSKRNRVGLVAAGLAVGLAGCRHPCADRVRKPDCDPCAPTRYAAVPRPAAACPDCPPGTAAFRQPAVGVPVSATGLPGGFLPGPFGPPPGSDASPFAPTVPMPGLPNELPPPMETIPAPAVPFPAAPTAANVLPLPGTSSPATQPVSLKGS